MIHVVLLDFNYIENNTYFYILHWVYNQPAMSSLHVFLTSHVIAGHLLDQTICSINAEMKTEAVFWHNLSDTAQCAISHIDEYVGLPGFHDYT